MFCALCVGMDNKMVLEKLRCGYRMPHPTGENVTCPSVLYEIMLSCWNERAEDRPTFEFLRSLFDDYFVATQGQYRDIDAPK